MLESDLSGRWLGEFVLRERIGQGGFGAVYRSEQPLLKREVVVKVLWRNDTGSQERFLREAQLASQLDHPYAAHVYAFGAEDKSRLLWIAMELVQGITLAEWLKTRGPMPLEQFVPFFECIAQVVHAAHERRIVHRDLKPSNVMVIERGGRLFPKLLDFGIAKVTQTAAPRSSGAGSITDPHEPSDTPGIDDVATAQGAKLAAIGDDRLTRTDAWIGSRPYMSPEQWNKPSAVGPATDIYSLGIVAYETLTGRIPFPAESTGEYCRQHCMAEVPPLGGAFTADVERVLRRALAKDGKHRQRNVLELASELRATLQAQPREQLRSLAQVWDAHARSPALLLKSGDLLRAQAGVVGELERAFITASQRHTARRVQLRRFLAVSAAALVLGAVWYRGELKAELAEQHARAAQQLAEATVAQLEQGRSALLHNEPEALLHLTEAYRRDRSPSTAFMLARAMQPRLAEQARFASSFGRMLSAVFSPDGARLVTTDDRNAQVWDAQTHQLVFTLPHGDSVPKAVFSSDGARIVTAGNDGAVRIWDAASGALARELRPRGAAPRYFNVALSSDGTFVAAIDLRGDVAHLWSTARDTPLAEIRNGAADYQGLAFSADGQWLAMTGGDEVRILDTRTRTAAVLLGGRRVRTLAFHPTASRLVTGAHSGEAAVWDIPSGARIRRLRESGESITAVAYSPDGQRIAAASSDGAVQIWNATSGELQSQFVFRSGNIRTVEFDRTSQLVVAAGSDGAVVVADATLGMLISVLDGPQNTVRTAHFDARSQRILGASWDGTARIWDATSPYRRWSSPPTDPHCGIATGTEPDGRFIAVGCWGHATRVWDTARDHLLAELPSVSTIEGDFTSAFPAVSAAGDRAAIARDHRVEVYELPGGRLLRTIEHRAPVNAVAFAKTGRDVVSGAIDGSLLVARDSGALLTLPRSAGGIDAVGFCPTAGSSQPIRCGACGSMTPGARSWPSSSSPCAPCRCDPKEHASSPFRFTWPAQSARSCWTSTATV